MRQSWGSKLFQALETEFRTIIGIVDMGLVVIAIVLTFYLPIIIDTFNKPEFYLQAVFGLAILAYKSIEKVGYRSRRELTQ